MKAFNGPRSRVGLLIVLACAAGIANAEPELAEGEGKQAVEELCTSCHSLTPIVSVRHTSAEWRAVVDNMASLGAQGSDDDFNAVVEYLSRNYGKSLVDWRAGCAGGVVFGGVVLGYWRRRRRRSQEKT